MNLDKLFKFDHLTEAGKLNKIYTICFISIAIISIFVCIGIWPDPGPKAGPHVITVFIELLILFLCGVGIFGTWNSDWGAEYLQTKENYLKKFEKEN